MGPQAMKASNSAHELEMSGRSNLPVCPKNPSGERTARATTDAFPGLEGDRLEIPACTGEARARSGQPRAFTMQSSAAIPRVVLPGPPIRAEYALTESGRSLEDFIRSVGDWAERWVR